MQSFRRMLMALVLFSSVTTLSTAQAALGPDGNVFLLPLNCSELLPDNSPFLNFFEAVGRGQASTNRTFSERIFRILSLRELLARHDDKSQLSNPVDFLVRRTLCFYRTTKDATKPVTFDDADFLAFLKGSMKELESKVDEAILDAEYERQERVRYEKQLLENQKYVESVRRRADEQAGRIYQRLKDAAARKLRSQR